MPSDLLNAREAAQRLGISVHTLYGWLSASSKGRLEIHNRPLSINYFQTGRRGQGRIKIESQEIDRLLLLMQPKPESTARRKRSKAAPALQHITTPLERPDD